MRKKAFEKGVEKYAKEIGLKGDERKKFIKSVTKQTNNAATTIKKAKEAHSKAAGLTKEADALSALLLGLLGAGTGGGLGYLAPYLSGAEPADNWTRYLPAGLGAAQGGLIGATLGATA